MEGFSIIAAIILVAIVARLAMPAWALSGNVERERFVDQDLRAWAVAAATHIYKGGAVGVNAAGYLVPYTAATLFVGMAYEECDNSAGAAGAKSCMAYTVGDFVLPVTGIAITDAGRPVFATSDGDFSLSPTGGGQIGSVVAMHGTGLAVVRIKPQFELNNGLLVGRVEVDCTALSAAGENVIIPAVFNESGLAILHCAAIVTERFAGASQDQGIVTLQDTDGTTLALTFTPADAGADALNDFLQEGGASDTLVNAASGDAGAVVPAGKGVQAAVTQAAAGAGAAGKLKIIVVAVPV